MAYEDRYGSTSIIDRKYNSISISFDDFDGIRPILLYTPDMTNLIDHEHIFLSLDEAKVLRDWLDKFLNDPNLEKRYKKDLENK